MWKLEFRDKELVCEQCHRPFVWGAGEQEFYAVMGFDNDPRRCPACRAERRQVIFKRVPIQHPVNCARCGKATFVPFVPRQGRPVYCRECYAALNAPQVKADLGQPAA